MTRVLRYAARSDRGLIRGNNEDSVYAGPRLLAVADGMGGHVGGEVASKIVISELAPLDEDTPGDDLIAQLRTATENANSHLRDAMEENPSLEGMGTTLTALLFSTTRLGLVHVGDSRGYLLRAAQLTQITHDATFVQALVDQGRITEEEATVHPQRSLILRVLNGSEVEPDLSIREARVGDRYLLCSDGLTDVVSTETVYEALQLDEPQECADRLVELALRAGGPDNVTCIVADIVDVDFGDDAPVVDGAAGGNRGQRQVHPNSAAARAALANPATSEDTDDEPTITPPTKRRRRMRFALISLAVLLVLAAGGVGLWQWTQTQYFVAAEDGRVAVFRGVNTSVGPLNLFSMDRSTDLRLDELQPVARSQVEAGINAEDEQDAERILENLRDQRLPPCADETNKRTPGTGQPSGGQSSSTSPGSVPPSLVGSATTSASPTDAQVPGQDCRETG